MAQLLFLVLMAGVASHKADLDWPLAGRTFKLQYWNGHNSMGWVSWHLHYIFPFTWEYVLKKGYEVGDAIPIHFEKDSKIKHTYILQDKWNSDSDWMSACSGDLCVGRKKKQAVPLTFHKRSDGSYTINSSNKSVCASGDYIALTDSSRCGVFTLREAACGKVITSVITNVYFGRHKGEQQVMMPVPLAHQNYCNAAGSIQSFSEFPFQLTVKYGGVSCFHWKKTTEYGSSDAVKASISGIISEPGLSKKNCHNTIKTTTKNIVYPALKLAPYTSEDYFFMQKQAKINLPYNATLVQTCSDGSMRRFPITGTYEGMLYSTLSENVMNYRQNVYRCSMLQMIEIKMVNNWLMIVVVALSALFVTAVCRSRHAKKKFKTCTS